MCDKDILLSKKIWWRKFERSPTCLWALIWRIFFEFWKYLRKFQPVRGLSSGPASSAPLVFLPLQAATILLTKKSLKKTRITFFICDQMCMEMNYFKGVHNSTRFNRIHLFVFWSNMGEIFQRRTQWQKMRKWLEKSHTKGLQYTICQMLTAEEMNCNFEFSNGKRKFSISTDTNTNTNTLKKGVQ